jgi:hypothetical protein
VTPTTVMVAVEREPFLEQEVNGESRNCSKQRTHKQKKRISMINSEEFSSQ